MKNFITTVTLLLFSSLVFGQIPNYISTNGLVGWWPFNGNANDESGNGNNGTVNGPLPTTDRFGNSNKAYLFNGGNDHIQTNYSGILGQNPRSISFWYYSSGSQGSLMFYGLTQPGARMNIYLYPSGGGHYATIDNSNSQVAYNPQIAPNTWNHLVYTFDPADGTTTNSIKIYLNGNLLTTYIVNTNGSQIIDTQLGDALKFGSVSGQDLFGKMDDIAIWNRALSQCEITALYEGETQPCQRSCIAAQYDFSGNANDLSGNLNHGTVNGATLIPDRFGNSNSAYQFDGVNDYIETTLAGPLGNNSRTISFWAKTNSLSHQVPVDYGNAGAGNSFQVAFNNPCEGIGVDMSSGVVTSATDINDNLWHQYLVVYDASFGAEINDVKFYQDGILLPNSSCSALNANGLVNTAAGVPLTIGANTDLTVRWFNGGLDDIKVFECAFDATQADSIYQAERTNPIGCMVARYDFNGNANDVSGYANHGTVNGATLTTDRFGNSNSAYQFDGIDDHITGANSAALESNNFTIAGWMRPESLHNGTITGKTTDLVGEVGYRLSIETDGKMYFVVSRIGSPQPGTGYTSSISNYPISEWTYVVGVRNGDTIKIYVDGQFENQLTSINANINTTTDFTIGRTHHNQAFFNGQIDDVKYFNCALSSSQIDSIYQAERTNPIGCMVARYDFNGNANDVSGYANHGTVNGATLTTDRFGNANSAYQFDGVNDFIDCGNLNALNGVSEFTFSTWINGISLNNNRRIIGKEQNGNPNDGLDLQISTGPNLAANVRTGVSPGGAENLTTNLISNTWYHASLVYNGNGATDNDRLKIFINGIEQPLSFLFPIPPLTSTNSFPLWIGGISPLATESPWHGSIDDIKIFNCALTSFQIDSIYDSEAPLQPCGIVVSGTPLPPFCHDGNNGTIDLTVSGGQSPYTFQWNNSQSTEDLAGLVPGNYTVIVTDAAGCDTMITYNVFNPVSMDINLNITNPSCGNNNGFATATVLNGGTGPFNYQWSSGDTLATADSLSAGIYMLTVTDPNGCSAAETFGVNNSGGLSLSAIVTDASCEGVNDGDINLTVSGGTSPYTYSWSNASTNEDLTNVKAGAYMVEVTDANGCVAVLNTSINANSIDLSNVNITDPSCGDTDGSITLNPTGGSSPYDYLWSSNAGSATTSSVSSLGAGTYFVTVTDNNGCEEIEMYSLSNTNGPSVSVNSISSADCGGTGGSINIGITSGVSPFTYEWSNGETTQDISDLDLGSYSVDVTDGDGCVTSLNVNVPGVTLDPITLCMSTVNEANGKVLCIWDKPAVDYISHFNIYRENSIAGQYDFWFSRPYDSTSQWTDQTANPQIRGWRYKVTYVDTCGNESPFGINHKTIHVTANLGVGNVVNLIWDHYEGFNFPTFYIERYHPSTGWETIDSIPSTLHSYTDNFPPNGNLQYAINIKSPSACDPTRAGVNTSRSNVKNQSIAAPESVLENENDFSVNIYPNPAKDEVFISMEKYNGGDYDLKIFNSIGEMVMVQKLNATNSRIDTKNLSGGFYTMEIISEKNKWVKKLIIQK